MASKFESAQAELHRAPFAAFVAERKRLVDELAKEGDKAAAARLAKLPRPPISAWAVNQLYWKEKKAFEALFKTAERLRDPGADAAETTAHRDAVTKLRTAAAKLLASGGKAATEATLRRVTATLSALAASGSFAPDTPGALTRDRDPPGFEVAGLLGRSSGKRKAPNVRKNEQREKANTRAEAQREKRELERDKAQKRAERERLERKLRIARGALDARREELTRLRERIDEEERGLRDAREVVRTLEKELTRN
ncbi:MAG TPA: hypothetical protein VF103_16755 [Polyangiaceae bacterium]